jgi:probable phosphoglycerate mutase
MTIPPRRFLYVRHGETDWNAESRAQGLSDIPLNARGRDQARDAARILAGVPVAAIIASPLSRAHETATIIAETLDLPVTIDEALREVSFGEREGATMAAWYEDWIDSRSTPPGGESFDDLSARGAAAIARHLAPTRFEDTPILFVAHGALFRGIRRALGLSIHVRLANGAPLECRPTAEAWEIVLLQPGNTDAPTT